MNSTIPPLASVWDQARTTIAQAREIRKKKRGEAVADVPFALDVDDVRSLRHLIHADAQLDVLRDELPEQDGPGADGHSGIFRAETLPKRRA